MIQLFGALLALASLAPFLDPPVNRLPALLLGPWLLPLLTAILTPLLPEFLQALITLLLTLLLTLL